MNLFDVIIIIVLGLVFGLVMYSYVRQATVLRECKLISEHVSETRPPLYKTARLESLVNEVYDEFVPKGRSK